MTYNLPPLPSPAAFEYISGGHLFTGYAADQMREYGRTCEQAAYERAIKAVEDAGGKKVYVDYHTAAIRTLGNSNDIR